MLGLQNRMVRTIQNFELFDKKWSSIGGNLEDVSVTKAIFSVTVTKCFFDDYQFFNSFL